MGIYPGQLRRWKQKLPTVLLGAQAVFFIVSDCCGDQQTQRPWDTPPECARYPADEVPLSVRATVKNVAGNVVGAVWEYQDPDPDRLELYDRFVLTLRALDAFEPMDEQAARKTVAELRQYIEIEFGEGTEYTLLDEGLPLSFFLEPAAQEAVSDDLRPGRGDEYVVWAFFIAIGVITIALLVRRRAFALHRAITRKDASSVRKLLAKGVSLRRRAWDGLSPLHLAVFPVKKSELVMRVVRIARDSPIHLTAFGLGTCNTYREICCVSAMVASGLIGDREIVELLLENGANPNQQDRHGSTPLHFAAASNQETLARLLIAKRADPDAKDEQGATPLHVCVQYGHDLSLCRLLLDAGADVNARDQWKDTPLHLAAEHGSEEVVSLLIAQGADLRAKNHLDEIPFVEARDEKIRAMLDVHGVMEQRGERFVDSNMELDFEDCDFAHVFLTQSVEAAAWLFWHCAKYVYETGEFDGCRFLVVSLDGARESGVFFAYEGLQEPISAEKLEEITGMETTTPPIARVMAATGGSDIGSLVSDLAFNNIYVRRFYRTGDGVPEDEFGLVPTPPDKLHPSKWGKPSPDKLRTKPEQFAIPVQVPKNPAVAFSRFANDLQCKYCGKVNVAPEWPPRGDYVPFYYQTPEETEEQRGAYTVEVHCPHCDRDWYVVWDSPPI